jgi:hypothetical protein
MPNPSLSGHLAQAAGNSAQVAFEASLAQYRVLGLATGQRNYPEISQRGFNARVIGKASTDYTAFIAPGKSVQFEVKTWQARDEHTYSFDGKAGMQRRTQYLMMVTFASFIPTVYLVLWRFRDGQEWRIYPVLDVPQIRNGLFFVREAGWLVEETRDGWPDWLGIISKV